MTLSRRRIEEYQPERIQSRDDRWHEVARDLIAVSYRRGQFVVGGGVRSGYHLDPSLFMTKPTLLRRLGSLLAEQLDPDVDRVAGSEPGSVALAIAVSLHTGLPFVTLRAHGAEDPEVHGELHPGEKVILIEDVLSTGQHAVRGAAALQGSRADLRSIIGVLDREEGAADRVANEGLRLITLYRAGELQDNALLRGTSDCPTGVGGGEDVE